MAKGIYQFFVDCGRMGDIDGVFIEEKETVAKMVEAVPTLYFGEVLGKHSEVIIDLQPHHIDLLSDDQNAIEIIEKILGTDVAGFNPVDYWEGKDD